MFRRTRAIVSQRETSHTRMREAGKLPLLGKVACVKLVKNRRASTHFAGGTGTM